MRRVYWTTAGVLASATGCVSGPMADNPAVLRPTAQECVVIHPGTTGSSAYDTVFGRVLDVLDDYFEIAFANRHDGHIVCKPRVAPGIEQPWKPGSPSFSERLYATLQSTRHRAEVFIQPDPSGGYSVQVVVYKELEDIPRPTRSLAGNATFRNDSTVERSAEVLDPTAVAPQLGEAPHIPKGRDTALEQELLRRIQKCL